MWVSRMFKEQVTKVLFRTMFSNVQYMIRQDCRSIPTEMILEVGHGVDISGIINKLESDNVKRWVEFDYDELACLDKRLAKAFPNVTRVAHSIHDPSTSERPFMSDFINQKAGQFSELQIVFPYNGSIDMGKLGIYLTPFSFLKSGLLPPQLVSQFNPVIVELPEVRLDNTAARRTLFSGGSGKGLELPRLKTLGLYIDSTLVKLGVPVDQRSTGLKFPEQMNLRLLGKGRVMRNRTSLVSLESIKQLSLGEEIPCGCVNMTDVLHEKNLLSSKVYAKRLVIDGEDLNESKTAELNHMVYTLQHCITARVTTLVVPSIVQLRGLQELDVRAILQSGNLVKLLKKLPNLCRLHARVYSNITSGILGPEYSHERKGPTYSCISKTVEFVETTFCEGTAEDKGQAYHAAWLIARLSELKRW
ncbi:hypothetical protein DL89DRAFT_303620 [Linderina pennispora]|uniref:Uncharacterized protein n=1 Tax=Linderina pennispora TaxID=61395 RepID=A0A1Y1W219_9FUNG|nr:uncharacterized protein DL89DRAFT_303620 [Linderina pennispora]ORX67492.1 hypothetical protein DL89DRAFT_303620 [Linderina pennispora]